MVEADFRQEEFMVRAYPVVRSLAQRSFAWMRCGQRHDDAVQDAVAQAWKGWRRLVLGGKDPAHCVGGLAALAVRCAKAGATVFAYVRKDEPLSPWCMSKLTGGSLVSLDVERGADGTTYLRELIADEHAQPWEEAIATVDFPAWLDTLPLQHRDVLERRLTGETCGAIAAHWRCTKGHVANLCSRLRQHWHRWSL